MAALGSPEPPCTHRWKIAAPVGEGCNGTCLLCGAVRHFTNERFPFGQPAKVRHVAPPKAAARAESAFSGTMAAFLTQHRAGLNEAARE